MSVAAFPDPRGELVRRSWLGVSSADRASARRVLLLDAAFDLLGTEGWAATTVRGVCRAAQLHPRYFYQAFADMDDLLMSVFDRLIDQLGHAINNAVEAAGADPVARTRAGLGAVAHFVADDRRRARILYTEALGHSGLARRRLDSMQRFVDSVGGATAGPTGPTAGRAQAPQAQVAAHLAVGGFTSVLVAWLDGRVPLALDDLVGEAAVLLLPLVPVAGNRRPAAADRRPGSAGASLDL
jgi:AcrR family transcriptional regulator